MTIMCKDYGRSKLSLVEVGPYLLRNLDFRDLYATTIMKKVVSDHKLQT